MKRIITENMKKYGNSDVRRWEVSSFAFQGSFIVLVKEKYQKKREIRKG